MTVDEFRQVVRVFDDPQEYPDAVILPYLTLADESLPPQLWGQFRDLGMAMWAAHFITLDERDRRVGEAGGVPGMTSGVISSKSVGSVSMSFDTHLGAEEDGGMWNLTSFGVRWLRFARLLGMGGFQNGGPDIRLDPTFGPAWPGVIR